MSQVTDFVTPGTPLTMAGLKAHLDACYAATGSLNRGAGSPPNPFEGMLWLDSSGGPTAEVLRRYTVAAGWVPIMTFNITTGAIVQLYGILDEDDMASDSALLPPSQQSVKAYIDKKANSGVGDIRFSLSATPRATEIKLGGGMINRADYPELWNYAVDNGLTVAEADWPVYSGLFSTGDLSTTFRLPDFRGVFPRFLDEGRGLDPGRIHGTYEHDELKEHFHTGGVRLSANTVNGAQGAYAVSDTSFATGTTGGAETRPKNITLYAFIRFE